MNKSDRRAQEARSILAVSCPFFFVFDAVQFWAFLSADVFLLLARILSRLIGYTGSIDIDIRHGYKSGEPDVVHNSAYVSLQR